MIAIMPHHRNDKRARIKRQLEFGQWQDFYAFVSDTFRHCHQKVGKGRAIRCRQIVRYCHPHLSFETFLGKKLVCRTWHPSSAWGNQRVIRAGVFLQGELGAMAEAAGARHNNKPLAEKLHRLEAGWWLQHKEADH